MRIAVAVGCLFHGCVAGSSGDSANTLAAKVCDGTWECDDTHDLYEIEGRLQGDSCAMGDLSLNADGTVSMPSDPGLAEDLEWSGDWSDGFAICIDGDWCLTCERPNDTADAGDGSGECMGSPGSCSSVSPGSCSSIRGCYLHTHYRYGGSTEERCAGSPHSCSGFYDERACEDQGCEWN